VQVTREHINSELPVPYQALTSPEGKRIGYLMLTTFDDDEALIDALNSGRIAGAALDVFNPEPLPKDHPYWSMPNVMVTPHLGGIFDEYAQRALPLFEENMRRFLAGDTQHMINLVSHLSRPQIKSHPYDRQILPMRPTFR
jgi:hypothetical protein